LPSCVLCESAARARGAHDAAYRAFPPDASPRKAGIAKEDGERPPLYELYEVRGSVYDTCMKRNGAKKARKSVSRRIKRSKATSRASIAVAPRSRSRSRSAQLLDEVRAVIGDSELEGFLTRLTTGLKALARKGQATARDLAVLRMGNEGRLLAVRETILGGALTSDQVAARLGRSRPTVHAMVKGGLLLAVRDGRALRFPAWQFADTEDSLVPGLRVVLGAADASALRTASWLLTPNSRLQNRAPLDLLRGGDRQAVELVVNEARALTGS
jgi:excisionase family DNA binding protein